MKLAKFGKTMLVFGLAAACAFALAACGADGSKSSVAATVNGTEISEDEITEYISNIRTQYNLEEEDAWGQYLSAVGMTPQSLREQIIDSKVDQILVKNAAGDIGVTVDATEIDSNIESMKGNFENDEAWQKALTQAGFTEESYREDIEQNLLSQAIQQHFSDEAKVEDADVLETAEQYATTYDGAKKSSHILIKVDDVSDKSAMKKAREKAQEIIDRINSGEIDFAAAAKEYSEDTGSAEDGGNVGWDKLTSFVTEYTDALEKLDTGEMSGPVDSEYGVHIIKGTDVFNAPKKVKSLKDFPKEFRETIKNAAKSSKANEDYQAWVDGLKESAEIVKNEMPSDAPYNIDMSKYEQNSGESGESAEGESSETEEINVEDTEESDVEIETSADAESASSEAASSDSAASSESASSASSEEPAKSE